MCSHPCLAVCFVQRVDTFPQSYRCFRLFSQIIDLKLLLVLSSYNQSSNLLCVFSTETINNCGRPLPPGSGVKQTIQFRSNIRKIWQKPSGNAGRQQAATRRSRFVCALSPRTFSLVASRHVSLRLRVCKQVTSVFYKSGHPSSGSLFLPTDVHDKAFVPIRTGHPMMTTLHKSTSTELFKSCGLTPTRHKGSTRSDKRCRFLPITKRLSRSLNFRGRQRESQQKNRIGHRTLVSLWCRRLPP